MEIDNQSTDVSARSGAQLSDRNKQLIEKIEKEFEEFQIHWIDPDPKNQKDIDELISEAQDFFEGEMECNEEYADEEDDEE